MSRQNNALPQMVEPLWSTYIHQKGARLGLPVTGTFELTPRCNFNCNMCYVHQTEAQAAQGGRRELTTAEWLAIAEEARKAGMVFLLLTGGEPLLRPDFPELLHALKNMGFLVSVNSNGSLLRGELLEAVKQDPPLRFNITLYGGSNATYERLCGRAMFQEVVDNLRALKDVPPLDQNRCLQLLFQRKRMMKSQKCRRQHRLLHYQKLHHQRRRL